MVEEDSDLHIQIKDVVPEDLERAILVVDIHGKPDIAALPDGVEIPLVSHVEVGRLTGTVDAPRKARLGAESASIGWRDEKGLRPRAGQAVSAEGNDVVGPISRLVAHEAVVAVFGLDDGRRFKIKLVPPEDDLLKIGQLVVEARQIVIATFDLVAVGVQGIGAAVLVVGEEAKVLRPVAQGFDGLVELIGPGDVF